MDDLILNGIHFQLVCEIKPVCDSTGQILTDRPQDRYDKASFSHLHRYGIGEFCRFRIPTGWNSPGVYAVAVDSHLMYIGECEDLSFRFNAGYGQISPKNCFVGDQQTNCRINKLILKAAQSAAKIYLYFYSTSGRKALESLLLSRPPKPPWNR
jgi:hypothetical protein